MFGKHSKNPGTITVSGLNNGASDLTRTGDLLITSGYFSVFSRFVKCRKALCINDFRRFSVSSRLGTEDLFFSRRYPFGTQKVPKILCPFFRTFSFFPALVGGVFFLSIPLHCFFDCPVNKGVQALAMRICMSFYNFLLPFIQAKLHTVIIRSVILCYSFLVCLT